MFAKKVLTLSKCLALIKNIPHFPWYSEYLNIFDDKIQMEKFHSK